MINTVFTSAAVLAMSTVVHGLGKAVVINQCSDTISMDNVPASGGGQSEISQSIAPGGSYSQQWTSLTNGQGWSMKLSPGAGSSSIVQYEYTFHNDGLIWYDVSAVNGDPFDGDWFISASGSCNPRQSAYRYPTDDTYGMQDACPDDSTITVTLCASGSGGSGGAAPASPSEAAPAPSAPAPSAPAPAPSAPAGRPDRPDRRPDGADRPDRRPAPSNQPVVDMPTPSVPEVPYPSIDPGAAKIEEGGFQDLPAAKTVTDVQTQVVTQFVTISPSPVKRSEHLRRHVHHHEHF